ncbi:MULTISPECIES: ParA family protein [Streptomyces]|uniref:AAA family ATPase n=1 Tax=Streptomyces muensis TaxID=1077944 RepID=A0A9X1PSY0_STRM4|nr:MULTISPECIES: AAA family ATPase [Streptomyces]MCF1592426.1 AAA family ATPase [Streptomyces muensis]QKV98187.1 AAA family ATPase [Streptomyces sp. NA02950]
MTVQAERVPRIISMTNQVGGSGKSTSGVNLGAQLAEFGWKVLVVDGDDQCDASYQLGYAFPDQLEDQKTIYDCLTDKSVKLSEAIVPALAGPLGGPDTKVIDNLYLVLGSHEMENAEQHLTTAMARELWLKNLLAPIKGDYDVIIIDCPGNLGLVVIGAILASDEIVACIKPGLKELRGLTRIEQKIELVKETWGEYGAHAELVGVLLVDVPTTRSQGAVWDDGKKMVEEAYGDLVLPGIRRSTKIPESYAHQKPLLYFDRAGEATADYLSVAKGLGFKRISK